MARTNQPLTADRLAVIDRIAIEKIGMPSLVLMDNAGRSVAAEVLKMTGKKKYGRIGVFCGRGNNGGDGFVAARYLSDSGCRVDVFLADDPRTLKNDTRIFHSALRNCGVPVHRFASSGRKVKNVLRSCDVIIDALFGVGLNRPIEGPAAELITAMNDSGRKIVAIDVPSGLDATTGEILGVCIKAAKTVTMSCPKRGFTKKTGPRMTGKIVVADIGIPRFLLLYKEENG